MTFENASCPCGSKKERQTMLCGDCCDAFKDRREMKYFSDQKEKADMRRHCALILLALARRRNRDAAPGWTLVRSGYR